MTSRGVIVGISVGVVALAIWRFTQPATSTELRLRQLTFDTGLTGWPAISADGRMLAYASDRDSGRNLDLYVQPIRGGNPVRFATGADLTEPAFSPDGTTVAFHSNQSGGGIYTVPTTGGDPHLLAAGGHTPRYSPDGRWIAFSDGTGVALVPSAGGPPRRFHPELEAARAPAWSPDGGSLIFWSRSEMWVAPLEGGSPEATGIAAHTDKEGLGPGPFDDALWTTDGYLFSARLGLVRNLFGCPLNKAGKAKGDVIAITDGTELIGDPSVSRDGHVVFSSGRQRFDIWGLPLDAETGKVSGAPYRITDTLAPTANPDISADGRRLIYGSSRNGFTEIWEKDLITGAERVAATSPEGASYGRLLKSSGRILYVQPTAGYDEVRLDNLKLAVGTRPWDADSKETTVLVSGAGIDALNVLTKQRTPLVSAPKQTTLSQASYSPDDRWILFLAETPHENARIYVAPAAGGEWLPVTDGVAQVDKPRFSPGGRTVYFTVDHDGFRDIDAVRFDSRNGATEGRPFPVYEPRSERFSMANINRQALEIAVARDKLITIFCETTSTIWMGELVLR